MDVSCPLHVCDSVPEHPPPRLEVRQVTERGGRGRVVGSGKFLAVMKDDVELQIGYENKSTKTNVAFQCQMSGVECQVSGHSVHMSM